VEVIHVWRFIRRNFLRCQDADDDDDVEVFLQRFLSAETMNTADDASSSSSSFLFWPADRCPVDLQLLKPFSIELLEDVLFVLFLALVRASSSCVRYSLVFNT